MTDTSKALLVASIRNRLFASRDTVDEALNYAIEVIACVNDNDRAAVYTALHVVMNTIADKIDALPDSSDQLPEPPAEVLVNSDGLQVADYPATGASDLEAKLITLIDSRLANWGAALPQREAHLDQRIKFHTKDFDRRIEESFNQLIEDYDLEDVVKNIIRNMSFSIDVD